MKSKLMIFLSLYFSMCSSQSVYAEDSVSKSASGSDNAIATAAFAASEDVWFAFKDINGFRIIYYCRVEQSGLREWPVCEQVVSDALKKVMKTLPIRT